MKRTKLNPKDIAQQRAGKPDLALNPPEGSKEQAYAHMNGAKKYGRYNWREQPIRLSVYIAAIKRHADAILDGEDIDPDSKRHPLGHIMATSAIVLDALKWGTLIDDRVIPKRRRKK